MIRQRRRVVTSVLLEHRTDRQQARTHTLFLPARVFISYVAGHSRVQRVARETKVAARDGAGGGGGEAEEARRRLPED